MKNLKLSIVALFITALSFGQQVKEQVKEALKPSELKWDVETHNFGELEKNKPASYDFTFTNTTKQTILITNVKPSCGCTAANYTKTPIKPGEKGFITATYNAPSPGNFNKAITVSTNEEGAGPKVLMIKGTVKAPVEKEDKSIMLK